MSAKTMSSSAGPAVIPKPGSSGLLQIILVEPGAMGLQLGVTLTVSDTTGFANKNMPIAAEAAITFLNMLISINSYPNTRNLLNRQAISRPRCDNPKVFNALVMRPSFTSSDTPMECKGFRQIQSCGGVSTGRSHRAVACLCDRKRTLINRFCQSALRAKACKGFRQPRIRARVHIAGSDCMPLSGSAAALIVDRTSTRVAGKAW